MNTFLDEVLFTQLLEESRLLSSEDFLFARQKSTTEKKSLPQTLLETGLLSKQEITKIIAMTRGVPFVDLTSKHVDLETFEHLPEPIARAHGMVCFSVDGDKMHVACMDLASVEHAQALHQDKEIVPHLSDNESISHALKKHQLLLAETFGAQLSSSLGRMRSPEEYKGLEEHLPVDYHTELAQDISTEKVVRNLITHARTSGASHVYFSPKHDVIEISYRIEGTLYEAMNIPISALPSIIIKLRHMVDAPILDGEKEVDSGYAVLGTGADAISLQILFFETVHGTKPIIRILKSNELFDSVETLIASEQQQELVYANLATSPMILIAGPSGSGKTRTYYGLLEYLGSKRKEVMSIEQPIEVALSGISQLQASSKKDLKTVLKQVVLSRPDVVALSPFVLGAHVSMLGALRSGISLVAQINSLDDFVSDLISSKIISKELLGSMNLVFVHQKFRALIEKERTNYTLSSEDINTISKYISTKELVAFLQHEQDPKISSLDSISFSARKGTRKSDQPGHVFARGVFSMNHATASLKEPITKISATKNIRKFEKRALLENALLHSLSGNVCIKEILKFLRN